MAIDKNLLRQAICDGVFSKAQQTSDGRIQPVPLTSDILEKVSLMPDNQIEATLVLYTANKKAALQKHLDDLSNKITEIQNKLDSLSKTNNSIAATSTIAN